MKCIYFKMDITDFAAYNQAVTFGGSVTSDENTETDESSNMAFLLSEERHY